MPSVVNSAAVTATMSARRLNRSVQEKDVVGVTQGRDRSRAETIEADLRCSARKVDSSGRWASGPSTANIFSVFDASGSYEATIE